MQAEQINFEQLVRLVGQHKLVEETVSGSASKTLRCACGAPVLREEQWARHVADEVVREFALKPSDR